MSKAKMIKWTANDKKPPFARQIDENTLEIKIKKKRYLITGTDFAVLASDEEDGSEQSIFVENGALDESELTIEELEVKDDEPTDEPELDANGQPVAKPTDKPGDQPGGQPGSGQPDPDNPDDKNPKGQHQSRPDEARKFSKRIDFTKKLEAAKTGGEPEA